MLTILSSGSAAGSAGVSQTEMISFEHSALLTWTKQWTEQLDDRQELILEVRQLAYDSQAALPAYSDPPKLLSTSNFAIRPHL